VSSRAISKLEHLDLSAATIRNIMADLEDLGFLSQPHTSAGRVPTDTGYHLYIDSLMPARKVSDTARQQIDERLGQAPADGEQLVATASELLSELSHLIGIVITPAMGETVLRAVSLVPLSGSRIHCFLVSATGFVDNKVIEMGELIEREELIRISNYLTDNFAGMTLRQIRERLLAMMAEERSQVDRLLAGAIALASEALKERDLPEVYFEGTSEVLTQPELLSISRVKRLLDTFDDKARLVQVLGRLIEGEGVRVVIGDDSDLTSPLDFSLVATKYGVGASQFGSLGIFGPSRMDYQTVIPLVDYLGERLTQALEETYGAGSRE
jgi:heat-inducible transcriptional repressor